MSRTRAEAVREQALDGARQPRRMLTAMNCSRHVRGGMPTANASLTSALSELGWSIDQLYLEDLPKFVGRRWANYPAFAFGLALRLARLEAERGPYEIVQVSGGDGFVAPLIRRDSRGRRRLLVAKSHGLEHRYWQAHHEQARVAHERLTWRHRLYFGGLRLFQVEQAVRQCDVFNCHTIQDADFVITRGWKPRDNVCVIGEGAPADWFNGTLRQQPFGGRLLWSGNWTWMKGRSLLPEIFRQLVQRDDLTLSLIGTGTNAAEVLRAFSPDLRHRVTVHPQLSHDDVLTAMRNHDLLLATSHFEGFGTAVVEAMAAGLPAIAADVAAAHDNITDGQTGFLVPPGDIDGFVQKTRSAIARLRGTDDGLTFRLAAREAVSSLTWNAIAVRTADAYEDALIRVRQGR